MKRLLLLRNTCAPLESSRMANQWKTPRMQAEVPKQRRARVETLTCLVKNLTSEVSELKQQKMDTFTSSHRPDRDRHEVHQPAYQATVSSVPNLRRSIFSNSINVSILSYVPSMNNFTSISLIQIGSDLLPLSVLIYSMQMERYRSSQKTLMIMKRLHLMKH